MINPSQNNKNINMRARSIVFFLSLTLTLASVTMLFAVPDKDDSASVPFDKNNAGSDYSHIEFWGFTKLAEESRTSGGGSSGSRVRRSTWHYYMVTDENDSRYIVRMTTDRADEIQNIFSAQFEEFQEWLDTIDPEERDRVLIARTSGEGYTPEQFVPITIYGRGETMNNTLPTLYTSNSRTAGSFTNVAQDRPRFENWGEFHETFGTRVFVEGRANSPMRVLLIIAFIASAIVFIIATPKYVSGRRMEQQNGR